MALFDYQQRHPKLVLGGLLGSVVSANYFPARTVPEYNLAHQSGGWQANSVEQHGELQRLRFTYYQLWRQQSRRGKWEVGKAQCKRKDKAGNDSKAADLLVYACQFVSLTTYIRSAT